jgi:hypothetical protein
LRETLNNMYVRQNSNRGSNIRSLKINANFANRRRALSLEAELDLPTKKPVNAPNGLNTYLKHAHAINYILTCI